MSEAPRAGGVGGKQSPDPMTVAPGSPVIASSEHGRSLLALTWMSLQRHKLAMASLVIVAVMVAACAAAPLIARYEFDAIDLSSIRQPPSTAHWMGTDDLGRDLFTRVLYGGRVSILIGLLSALVGTGLGSLVGALAEIGRAHV